MSAFASTDSASLPGRGAALDRLRGAYRAACDREPRLVLVEGEPGIGKSALLRRAANEFSDAVVLAGEGTEVEQHMDYGVIDQLLRPLDMTVLPRDGSLNLGLQLLEALSTLQARAPVVVVADDAQWIDAASLEVLVFALRRFTRGRLLCIFGARERDAWAVPEAVRRLVSARGEIVSLGPLDLVDLAQIARQHAIDISRSEARRLLALSGGNPRFALAVLRELPTEAWLDGELQVPPRSVAAFVRRCTHALNPDARALIEALAVAGVPCELALAAAVAQLPNPAVALDAAVASELVQMDNQTGDVGFTQPLYRIASYDAIGPGRRAALHLRTAQHAADARESLLHRAAAALLPDDPVAHELTAQANAEAEHGALAAAAKFFIAASRVTSERDVREHATLHAASCLHDAGMPRHARAVARGIEHFSATALRDHVRALLALSRAPLTAEPLWETAWLACNPVQDPELARSIATHQGLQWLLRFEAERALAWSDRARAVSPDARTPGGRWRTLRANTLAQLGRVDEARAVFDDPEVDEIPQQRVHRDCTGGLLRLIDDDLEEARAHLTKAIPDAIALRLFIPAACALCYLSRLEFTAGEWKQAAASAEGAVAIAEEFERELAPYVWPAAVTISAAQGQWERAEQYVRAAEERTLDCPDHVLNLALARATLSAERERPQAVADALEPVVALQPRWGIDEPGLWVWQPLYAHALVDLGRLDDAEAFLAQHENLAAARDRPSMIAKLARARGRVASLRGEGQEAAAAFEHALAQTKRVRMPYEQALIELAYGQSLRRRRQRRAAASRLEAAHEQLHALGARPALERCRRELEACGLQPRKRTDIDSAQLTPQERTIALLATEGRTSRAIAAELTLSVRTIDYHLGNIYVKLGLRSRAELARFMTARRDD